MACALLTTPFAPPAGASVPGEPAARRPAPRAATGSAPRRQGRAAYRAGQLLVRFLDEVPESERGAAAAGEGATRRALRGGSGVELWALSPGRSVEAAAATLATRPAVEFAEPNYLITADQFIPSDVRFPEQWALRNVGQSGGAAGADIGVLRAWAKTKGSPRTVLAVVDGGIDFTHPDLAGNRWVNRADPANGRDDDGDGFVDNTSGWDWFSDSGESIDPAGHGTAVAGLIAAEGDNHVGTAGVMWHASLLSLRVLDEQGTGDVGSAVEAIDYASSHGAHVINCSWGTDAESRALSGAVERAGARGALVVASAGNEGRNVDAAPRYPASYELPNVLSVAATDKFDHLTAWSNWGAGRAHVAAPGVELLTTEPGGGYQVVSGTSAAAALVAGVAGLVKTLRPDLPPGRVRESVLRNARPVPGVAARVRAGGVVSAAAALAGFDEESDGEGDGPEGAGRKKDKEKAQDAPGRSLPSATGAVGDAPGAAGARVPRGVRGRPASNLPDLDTSRQHVPTSVHAPPPVHSKLRNCPPRNPYCNGGVAATTPAPFVAAPSAASAQDVLVAAAGYRLPNLGVASDLSLVDHIRLSGGTADTEPAPYLHLPRLYARAAGLLPSLFPATFTQTGNNSVFVSQSVPTTMLAGETYSVSVTMTNTGSTTWSSANSYRLGSQNPADSAIWRLSRVQLPASVTPNGTAAFQFTVTAPTAAGTYNFQWRMVQDGVEWFGQATANAVVVVNAPAFEGAFESASCSAIKGWAWDSQRPNTPIEVDVFEEAAGGGDIFLARVVADLHRADLAAAGKGDGRHGYSFVPPASLRDGAPHSVKVRVANTTFLPAGTFVLSGSPKGVAGCAALPNATAPPASLVTTQATDSVIKVSWTPAAGAANYRVERAAAKSGPFEFAGVAASPGNSYEDHGRTRGVSYLYRVCSSDPSGNVCVSPYSNVTLGTAFNFFEPHLAAQQTSVKAQHFTELRLTINAVRAAAELPAASWGESVAAGGLIRASHVRELRAKLTEALSALNILPPSYTDPALGERVTVIRKAHVEELRLRSTQASRTVSNQSAHSGAVAPEARLDPANRAGVGGVDLLSGNFNWSLPLVSLRGRSGLDLGLSLSSNSLIWTRQGATLHFNADEGYPAPGFRLGFPVVQPQYYDTRTGKNSYLLLTPSGTRVELRQIGSTNGYESADSSYLTLYDNGGGNLYLLSPDGTRLTFQRRGYSHYVSEVRDRNGNRITAIHDQEGRLQSVTDTLSRTLLFNYDANQNLLSITQQRNGRTHTWATFGYGVATVGDVFSSAVTTSGVQEGQPINVLTQVGLADGSSYRFEYNGYAQIAKISRHSADNHRLAYTSYDLTADGDDCPRVAARRDWALDWNNEQEAVTTYAPAVGGAWGAVTMPDGTQYRERFDAGQSQAWRKGLVIETETHAGGSRQKWTALEWTQDDTALGYQKNPRITEGNLYDKEGNRRRTKTIYYTAAELNRPSAFGLAKDIVEYDADGAAVLRRTHLEYNLGAAYVSPDPSHVRHIIGLVGERHVYEGGGETAGGVLRSKVSYSYDETSDGRLVATPAAATQHDAFFGTGFSAGRGNLTGVRRWNVGEVNDDNPAFVETRIGYNTAGSVVFTANAEGHKSPLSYEDSFSDNANRNTFAYPTAATDPDQAAVEPASARKRSLTKYDYDTGLVTRVEGVSPNEGQTPPAQIFHHDAAGRIERVTNLVTNAYTRYVYSPGQTWVQSFTTVRDLSTEAYSIQVMDGAGRVYAAAGDFPSQGSAVRYYRGQHTVYDALGRAVRSSNPTQMTSSWEPVDEDATDQIGAGWYYSEQDYDWQGRPIYSRDAYGGMSQEMIYGGCGCAGGAVTTARDAVGRRQKSFSDVLGRVVKTQVLNFDGTIYSTQTTRYDALDRATRVRQYEGEAPASEPEGEDIDPQQLPNYQTVTTTFDGHGRLASRKAPVQTAASVYTYYADDQPHTIRDARAAVTTFAYNRRNLVTGISYSGVTPAPPAVSYAYDAAGNRTQMTDGAGAVTYVYDQASRLTSETRQFTGGLQGSYPITYDYTVCGQLKWIKDYADFKVTYSYDAVGQLLGVSGAAGAGSPTNYASNFKYRASGAVKEMEYGNGVRHSLSFDADMRHTKSALSNVKRLEGGATVSHSMTWDYRYNADGRLWKVIDLADRKFDRSYSYDQVGRLTEARTGIEAQEGAAEAGPYRQTFAYDVWENVTAMTTKLWAESEQSATFGYSNNKRGFPWQYDADGRTTADDEQGVYTFDAAGRRTQYVNLRAFVGGPGTGNEWQPGFEVATTYDGGGAPVRQATTTRTEAEVNGGPATVVTPVMSTVYYLRSTVMGGKAVAEISGDNGARLAWSAYAAGMEVARHSVAAGPESISYTHASPQTGSMVVMDGGGYATRAELDPLGADVTAPPEPSQSLLDEPSFLDPKWDFFWPLEYTSNLGDEYERGMADYEERLAFTQANIADASEARRAWQSGDRDRAMQILAGNPNVGLRVSGAGASQLAEALDVRVSGSGSFSVWGADAARALGLVYTPQELAHRGGEGSDMQRAAGNGDTAEYKRGLTDSEWKGLEPFFNLAREALENSDCRKWIQSGSIWGTADPLATLNALISKKHFFYGGAPGSYATTYYHYGTASESWVGLRALFFRQNKWERVVTILHELRHAVHIGRLSHPESSDVDTEAERLAFLRGGGGIETQAGFDNGINQHCVGPLKRAKRARR